jgi:membrane protein DedA with SNARE-associated domain
MYGLRTVMPFVFGISKFDPRRFAFLNFLGAFLWALIFGIAGYMFGQIVEVILTDVDKYELWLALAIVLVGAGVWLYRRRTSKIIRNEENHEYASAGTTLPADEISTRKGK